MKTLAKISKIIYKCITIMLHFLRIKPDFICRITDPAMLLIKTNNTMPSSTTTAFSSCRLSAMPHRTGSKHISILLGRVYPNCREYRKSSSFYQETHKDRRLLPNPALSGRCIEDFYPLVYFLGLCKGLSYLLYKNMFGKHPHRKNAPHSPYGKKDAQR